MDDPRCAYRKVYFAFLHSNDEQDEHIHYFFTTWEIQNHWYLNSKKDHYCFSLTEERRYEASETRTLDDTPGNYILTRPHGCPTALYKFAQCT